MSFTPVPASTAILVVGSSTVPGINWKNAIDGKLVDVSNFRDGRANAATLHDLALSFTLVWDAAAPPTDSDLLYVRPGNVLTVKTYTDATHYFTFSIMVSTVEPAVEGMENVVMMPVTAKLQGAITYPVKLSG